MMTAKETVSHYVAKCISFFKTNIRFHLFRITDSLTSGRKFGFNENYNHDFIFWGDKMYANEAHCIIIIVCKILKFLMWFSVE